MDIKSILLVEDNARDAELTLVALEENNFANEIVWVKDGVEAMDYLAYSGKYTDRKPGMPTVVLLDLKMPRMDGIEVLKSIRQDPKLKYLPVVMLTSSRQEEDLIKSYNLGVNAYVVKPVDLTEFISAIKQLGMFWVVINEIPRKH
ncbi:MAG TPA: response regulator [Sunxiuqinia sp.]|nr:response regulator [Sunxiuqinia sp.]